jgi:hypothetical protein
MHQIKEFLNFLDLVVGTFWSITMLDFLPILLSGQSSTFAISNISSLVNLLLAIAGLVYLVVRIIHFIRMSKLHIEFKKQEIFEKQNENFSKKWNKEFIKPFENESTK